MSEVNMYRTSHKFSPYALLLPFFLQLWLPTCFAASADSAEPMHLEADQVIMDDAQRISTFIGNVELSQGTLLIRGDRIVVTQDKEGFQHAVAYGDTAEFRQKRERMEGYVEGYGEQIEYDSHTGILNLYGKARLKRNLDMVSGNHIVYNIKTEIFKVSGKNTNANDDTSGRVRAVLQPKSNMTTHPASGVLPASSVTTPARQNE
jgi:lipopolysaccharide export system protein LptA